GGRQGGARAGRAPAGGGGGRPPRHTLPVCWAPAEGGAAKRLPAIAAMNRRRPSDMSGAVRFREDLPCSPLARIAGESSRDGGSSGRESRRPTPLSAGCKGISRLTTESRLVYSLAGSRPRSREGMKPWGTQGCSVALPVLRFPWPSSDQRRQSGRGAILATESSARLPSRELNEKTRSEVNRLIALDSTFDSFTDACTWPDHPRKRAEEHFVNVPRSAGDHDDRVPRRTEVPLHGHRG